ncbi:MAG: exopolysaccharide biosynthesis polyprenyl glycosylphosphotransferase [Candidatus Parcubacteria bacterium]|nr:exopolysaccharide biosynthesis polyprenyl glycosylphosphotransferase [Candidatus Parcubacteria bacterium]
MTIYNKKEGLLLFLGDIFVFVVSLWLALFARYLQMPTGQLFYHHLLPFSFIFAAWGISFFSAGLYGKHTLLFKSRLPTLLLNTQIINSVLAVIFFYFIPALVITPKVLLFVYLVISFVFILIWRVKIVSYLGFRKKQKAFLIGTGKEVRELYEEVNNNPRYSLSFVGFLDIGKDEFDVEDDLVRPVFEHGISVIVVDSKSAKIEPLLPRLYNLIFANVSFVDMHKVYEDIFDRVPLSLLRYDWFLQNVSSSSHPVYDTLKRLMDMAVSLAALVVSFLFYPFVFTAIKMDGGGKIFSHQDRVGKGNRIIHLLKFRTMTRDDAGVWGEEENRVTRVGEFLRKTRIDELPQLWNVLGGSISLIGPRPEFPDPVKQYVAEVPYYNVRHLIKPGLSGWAQIYHENHPHHGIDVEETKNKLSYDLYYIKNRSIMLDIKITLLTIRTILSRSGK